ncbi:hypothetical protein [Mesorhizobium sp. URHB0026]
MSSSNDVMPKAPDRTIPAAVLSIVMVLVGLIPAAIVVIIYSFFMRAYLGHSWIPYFDQISLLWFPELMRGLIAGAIAIGTTSYFFKNYNAQAVRLATFAFWGAAILLVSTFSISVRGLTLDLLGILALAVGLGFGLLSSETY